MEEVWFAMREAFHVVLKVLRDQAVTALLALLGVIIAFIGLLIANPGFRGAVGRALIAPTATSTLASQIPTNPVLIPTATVADPTFTPIPTLPPPTATVLNLAPAETLPENVVLRCNSCTDPIVITITQIEVQPANNRMIWTLTCYNNSQTYYSAGFDSFTLQEGEQTDHTFTPTGPAVEGGISLSAGARQQTTVTFSFVPYQGELYPLTSRLQIDDGLSEVVETIDFNPVPFTF